MSGVRVILVGSDEYDRWRTLKKLPPLLNRFSEYASKAWPDLTIIDDATTGAWTADRLRDEVPGWLASATEDSDLLLIWTGHGHFHNDHWLVTHETPRPSEGQVSTSNALATIELSQWILSCPARRIVVLLDTCWSGEGGHDLATKIKRPMAQQLEKHATRSLRVVSSARGEEEATEGAFLSDMLAVLESGTPPAQLEEVHRWGPDCEAITVDQLFAAVNLTLAASGHQAQSDGHGFPGQFFPLQRAEQRAPALPDRTGRKLEQGLPDGFTAADRPWTKDRLLAEADRLGRERLDPTGMIGWLMRRQATALSVLRFLEGWVGSTGLHVGLEPAWRASLPTAQTFQRPDTRFEYVEAVAAFDGDDRRLLEFVGRVVTAAGLDPLADRLYKWAKQELGADEQVVDDALQRATFDRQPARLIIDFGVHVEADGDDDALPTVVTGCLHQSDGVETNDVPFREPDGVAQAIGDLVGWAIERSPNGIDHVDLVVRVGLLRTAAPERAKLRRRRGPPQRVFTRRTVTMHWDERVNRTSLRSTHVVDLARRIEKMAEPILWVDPADYPDAGDLTEVLDTGPPRAVAFKTRPENPDLFYAALNETPYVLWVDCDGEASCAPIDHPEIQAEAQRRWRDFPGYLLDARLRGIWDDGDWLERLVPLVSRSRHRAEFGT